MNYQQQHEAKQFIASSFEEAFFSSTQTYIHPTAVVGSNVQLGQGVKIGPFCTVVGNTTIGDGTRIYPHATIGFPGQVLGLQVNHGTIQIGKNCEIREFVTINGPRFAEGSTVIGNNVYIMHMAHVAHDVLIEDNVVLNPNVLLGGHTHVERKAIIMSGSATHQFARVGAYTALAPFSGTRQDLPPYCLFSGKPAAFYGIHLICLKRAGFSRESINALKHVTKLFYQDKCTLDAITTLATQEPTWGADEHVTIFLNFIKTSGQTGRGISRRVGTEKLEETA